VQTQRLSIQAISALTGFDQKTIRKYLVAPEAVTVYGPRTARSGQLQPFLLSLRERLRGDVRNARVLLREMRQRGYAGG